MSDNIINSNKQLLNDLNQQISKCCICRDCPQYLPALAVKPHPICITSSKAKIALAGQAPGLKVFKSGIPFNDASGKNLRKWLGVTDSYFYDKDHFAIVPMGFCFPDYNKKGSDLPPRKECQLHSHKTCFYLCHKLNLY